MKPAAGAPHYIIDGYNVILHGGYASGKGGKIEGSVEDHRFHFLKTLSVYVTKKRVRITVVWDGGTRTAHPRSETRNGIQSIYTPQGMSADEHIVGMVEKRANPRAVTVVSDDRRHIITPVRNLGARTMGVEQFLSLIGNGRKKGRRARGKPEQGDGVREKKQANDLSVDDWLKLFQVRHTGNRNDS
jgi:predicted RNA-binding protein with PIN domain